MCCASTDEEIDFLLDRRVELNAFTSDALVHWIEGKLAEHGVKKVVPDDATLADAFRRAREQSEVQVVITKAVKTWRQSASVSAVPPNLRALLEQALNDNPERTWDSVVREIAGGE